MSTFNGVMEEFPHIRVDFFRNLNPAPLACFLSHIHTDHLAGLDRASFNTFIYCSAATREMLLRLETYSCRMEYARGRREERALRYKHLKKLLKPLPLETPVRLNLGAPETHVQVTLFDANHCPGSVMFLFESQGKAALYTGDIRSEPWFVNALARSPTLIEYTSGLRTIDTIYLDTSYTDDYHFQTKAEGLAELLQKVSKYPPNTVFHFSAWTYGYEGVWIALSKALKSPVHVDEYQWRLYSSLVAKHPDKRFDMQFHMTPEAAGLAGFQCANSQHPGCLTRDEKVRLHSCEKGNYCKTIKESDVVWIQPIVCRGQEGQEAREVVEVGIGGGGRDLDDPEVKAELDPQTAAEVMTFLDKNREAISLPDELRDSILTTLLHALKNGRGVSLDLPESAFDDESAQKVLVEVIRSLVRKTQRQEDAEEPQKVGNDGTDGLPRMIHFPYSRHASHEEQCHLVDLFKPKDVWPCTVEPYQWLKRGLSIEGLFGSHCSGTIFRYDDQHLVGRFVESQIQKETQETVSSAALEDLLPLLSSPLKPTSPVEQKSQLVERLSASATSQTGAAAVTPEMRTVAESSAANEHSAVVESIDRRSSVSPLAKRKRSFGEVEEDEPGEQESDSQEDIQASIAAEYRILAYQTMLQNASTGASSLIGLLSTTDNHSKADVELGERRR